MSWSRDHKKCARCSATKFRHVAKGLCSSCYMIEYKKDPKNRERVLRGQKKAYQRRRDHYLVQNKIRRERVHFDGKRQQVLRRDSFCCCRCNRKKPENQLTVHHKNRKGRGRSKPDNRISNLETVCRACHLEEHRAELTAARHARQGEKLLACGRWSLKNDQCIKCGTKTSQHASKGLCSRCYQKRNKMT